MGTEFRALVVNKTEESFSVEIRNLTLADLPEGEVTIEVAYSSVNYKDGLAAIPNGKIVRSYPFVPGIDLAGTVIESKDSRFQEGDKVLVTGYDLGVAHYGGFSQVARVPADWVVPLPKGLSMKDAMAVGTAGFTAALSIHQLEQNGLTPDKGPVLVTGATGGVGSMAVAMLANKDYHIIASTGKEAEHDYLRQLGAKEILSREELNPEKINPLDKQRWAAVIDPVGGKGLTYLLSTTSYGGSVAVSGLTAGVEFTSTVFPFILRGVNLLGIDSVHCTMDVRLKLWDRIAGDLRPQNMKEIGQVISLDDLPQTLALILKGQVRGRTIVQL